jgi:GxxExxY protein
MAIIPENQKALMDLNRLTSQIIKAAIAVHRELGPGLLESVYKRAMIMELERLGLEVEYEVPVKVFYRGQLVDEEGFRMDILVEDTVVVELKSAAEIRDVHKKQLLTYLRMARKKLGLLINFNVVLLKNGITRIINTVPSEGPVV